ncbi:MAG: DUF1801 domain-containing protein [Planctomycetota bacterium]
MPAKPATLASYLASVPADRRAAIEAVRTVVNANLDKDYEEGIQYGMIGWYVPHRVYPAGYHCDPRQPLPFAGLAAQKNYSSLYLMCVYGDTEHAAWFRREWAKTGKKLDMGKSCIRFQSAEDLALDVIGEAIRRVPAAKYIAAIEKFQAQSGKKGAGKAGAKKATSKRKA